MIQPQPGCLIPYLFLPPAMCITFIWLSALMELLSRHLATTRKTTHFSATHTHTHAARIADKKSIALPGAITLHYFLAAPDSRIPRREISSLAQFTYFKWQTDMHH